MIPFAFDGASEEMDNEINLHTAFLSRINYELYNCCLNSYCYFVGPNEQLTQCLYYHEPCYNASRQPHRIVTYIPIISCLFALYRNRDMAMKMDYCAEFNHLSHVTVCQAVNVNRSECGQATDRQACATVYQTSRMSLTIAIIDHCVILLSRSMESNRFISFLAAIVTLHSDLPQTASTCSSAAS